MSAPRAACTPIDSSGPRKRSDPSMYDRKRTPASEISSTLPLDPRSPRRPFTSSATPPWASENTWKPPESVITAPGQPMNSRSPPSFAMRSGPGVKKRWKVLPRTIWKPRPATSAAVRERTLPRVANGMNAGVFTAPPRRCSIPVRAVPSFDAISNRRRPGSLRIRVRLRGGPCPRPPADDPAGEPAPSRGCSSRQEGASDREGRGRPAPRSAPRAV